MPTAETLNSSKRMIYNYSLCVTTLCCMPIIREVLTHTDSSSDYRFGNTWFSFDISISKSFFNKIKMSATDIFNTSNSDWTTNTYGVLVNKRQSIDYRGTVFQPEKEQIQRTKRLRLRIKAFITTAAQQTSVCTF